MAGDENRESEIRQRSTQLRDGKGNSGEKSYTAVPRFTNFYHPPFI